MMNSPKRGLRRTCCPPLGLSGRVDGVMALDEMRWDGYFEEF